MSDVLLKQAFMAIPQGGNVPMKVVRLEVAEQQIQHYKDLLLEYNCQSLEYEEKMEDRLKRAQNILIEHEIFHEEDKDFCERLLGVLSGGSANKERINQNQSVALNKLHDTIGSSPSLSRESAQNPLDQAKQLLKDASEALYYVFENGISKTFYLERYGDLSDRISECLKNLEKED